MEQIISRVSSMNNMEVAISKSTNWIKNIKDTVFWADEK